MGKKKWSVILFFMLKGVDFYFAFIYIIILGFTKSNIMDYNSTLAPGDNFLSRLETCFKNQIPVSLIVDEEGWDRAEGQIIQWEGEADSKKLVLDSGRILEVNKIVAVNGVFLSDCSC